MVQEAVVLATATVASVKPPHLDHVVSLLLESVRRRLGKIKVIYTKTVVVVVLVALVALLAPERMDSAVLGMPMLKLVQWD